MRSFVAGMLVVVALVVAGCGGGSSSGGTPNGEVSKPAQEVVSDAVTAAEAASSLHMSGSITNATQQIGVDLTIVKGKGATGSITLQGHKIQLVVIGTDAYLNADAAFYRQFGGSAGSAAAALVAGKWLKFPTSNPQFGSITTITDSKTLFNSLTSSTGALTNKGAQTYNGQSAVAIFDGGQNGTLYVAATGTAFPIAIAKSGSGSGGSISFDSWNKSVTLSAPSGAIDISALTGG